MSSAVHATTMSKARFLRCGVLGSADVQDAREPRGRHHAGHAMKYPLVEVGPVDDGGRGFAVVEEPVHDRCTAPLVGYHENIWTLRAHHLEEIPASTQAPHPRCLGQPGAVREHADIVIVAVAPATVLDLLELNWGRAPEEEDDPVTRPQPDRGHTLQSGRQQEKASGNDDELDERDRPLDEEEFSPASRAIPVAVPIAAVVNASSPCARAGAATPHRASSQIAVEAAMSPSRPNVEMFPAPVTSTTLVSAVMSTTTRTRDHIRARRRRVPRLVRSGSPSTRERRHRRKRSQRSRFAGSRCNHVGKAARVRLSRSAACPIRTLHARTDALWLPLHLAMVSDRPSLNPLSPFTASHLPPYEASSTSRHHITCPEGT